LTKKKNYFKLSTFFTLAEYYNDNYIAAGLHFQLKFDDVKAMFDPIINRIIQLIDSQLRLCDNNCFAILLIGEFGPRYLQLRIEENFRARVRLITRSPYSKIAIVRGGKIYKSINAFFFSIE
jgi:hypothetical protein